MKDTIIRRAVMPDIPYLYEICLKTGNAGKDASGLFNDPYIIGQYYAAPYLVFPASVCFVVEYGYRPHGYVIAAPDTAAFNRWLEKEWLPPIRARYPQPFPPEIIRSPHEERILGSIHHCHFPDTDDKFWLKDYPAHLHIDLLPGLQGKGYGRILMDKLCEELAQKGIPGVHLGVGAKNQNAISFYQKMNFSVLREEDWGLIMGKATT
jgi:GNAT superfamily N-acetyltransferase